MLKLHCVFALAAAGMAFAGDLADVPHPRLWLPESDGAALKQRVANDPLLAKMQAAAVAKADRVLKARTCRYEILDGLRLLHESRRAIENILASAWAWRTTGREAYRDRAIAELDAACAFKDWNPRHFLDVGEMATAVAIGYDWLYPVLTPEQRARYERAIIDKALKPAKAVYDGNGWWSKPGNNWSQVCGAGIAFAAAAIAGHDEGLSEPLFEKGRSLVGKCGAFYQPDGMYPEGPAYWQYGTSYHAAMQAACEKLGRPLGDAPELQKAGNSIMHLAGPDAETYNFSDGPVERAIPTSAQCWIAGHYRDSIQTTHVRDFLARAAAGDPGHLTGDRFFPLVALWLPPAPERSAPQPCAAAFRGKQPMALFRSGWKPGDSFLAIKGGTCAASHGHMDAGSFVYDTAGERWCHDLGPENYNLPGYFGGKRWTYYRLQNRAHNTLEIAGRLQSTKAAPCPLTASQTSGPVYKADFDLGPAYAGAAASARRSASFDPATGVAVIEDSIGKPAGEVVWRVVTDAEPEIKGDTVTLRKKGSAITLRRLSKQGEWSVADAKPPTPEENPNKGFRVVKLSVPAAPAVGIRVEIRPQPKPTTGADTPKG